MKKFKEHDLILTTMVVFVLSFVFAMAVSTFIQCGNAEILSSTHKRNINGDWVPDSVKSVETMLCPEEIMEKGNFVVYEYNERLHEDKKNLEQLSSLDGKEGLVVDVYVSGVRPVLLYVDFGGKDQVWVWEDECRKIAANVAPGEQTELF